MSEFKFACPVCGQHMMCDASHGGSVMECPTCFQKIVAPQAPAPDAKFILTGTKLTEKKILVRDAVPLASVAKNQLPTAIILFLVALFLAAGAGIYYFRAQLFPQANVWTAAEVGSMRARGSFTRTNDTFIVAGSGADIWFQGDGFEFVSKPLNGDGSLTARVVKMDQTDPWAKAGVMIRESLEPDAKYAMAFATPANGIAFQQRNDTGGQASSIIISPGLAAPRWFRLTRQGDLFTAYSSADGTLWKKMGSTTFSMGNQVLAGLAVCSHNDGTLCQAQFDHVDLQAGKSLHGANPPAAPLPAPVAPRASSTNWSLDLETAVIPETPAAGRIHGQDFIVENASFQNGTLTLRAGRRGPVESGLLINFLHAPPESLAGQSINISPDTDKAAPVSLRWKNAAGAVQKEKYNSGYALRLKFGTLDRNRLPGEIYLCTPDTDQSYLMGTFTAQVRKPNPKR